MPPEDQNEITAEEQAYNEGLATGAAERDQERDRAVRYTEENAKLRELVKQLRSELMGCEIETWGVPREEATQGDIDYAEHVNSLIDVAAVAMLKGVG